MNPMYIAIVVAAVCFGALIVEILSMTIYHSRKNPISIACMGFVVAVVGVACILFAICYAIQHAVH
jgi:hypothetical protein